MRLLLVAAGPTIVLAAVLAVPSIAAADVPASHGIFAEGGLGVSGFLTNQEDAKPGPDLQLRLGDHLSSWLSIGLHLGASSHEATVPPPPSGEWFQLYRAEGDARLGFRAGRWGFFAEGGAGAAYLSSNVLEKVMVTSPGQHLSIAFDAGGGITYQIENRHYSFGLAGDWWLAPQFSALAGVDIRLMLRYSAD